MRKTLTLLIATLAAGPVLGQSREDYDAAAALALQVAVKRPATALSLAEAKAVTLSRRVPVLVRVGELDCGALCATLRPDLPTCHTSELAGDRSPHLRLLLADVEGTFWLSGERWSAVPAEAEVRRAAAELKRQVDAPRLPMPIGPSCPGGVCPAPVRRW
ncbi:MAG: hypothetical protein ACJ8F7_12205 [Gemmataceae bacterium]